MMCVLPRIEGEGAGVFNCGECSAHLGVPGIICQYYSMSGPSITQYVLGADLEDMRAARQHAPRT